MFRLPIRALFVCVLGVLGGSAVAQLRVANWNVTNYSSGRTVEFGTCFYTQFESRKFAPDVLVAQELISQTGVNNFLAILNNTIGSPGDWAAAPFVNGPDTDGALFYRTSKVQHIATTVIAAGTTTGTDQPRNTLRHDLRPIGYNGPNATLAIYNTHMKSGSTVDDQARRLLEAQRIRANAETLPTGWNFMISGDFNIQSSSQAAYVEMVGSKANNAGQVHDPIATPGNWNNSSAYKYVFTQEPTTQMDDRLDQLLLSASLINGSGMDYIGNPAIPYSTTTWNDPNHSYRCWGNDGTTFDSPIAIVANTMVGPVVAQALVDTMNGNGHLPVYLDFKVPPRATVSAQAIDFGFVRQGSSASVLIEVSNSANTALWTTAGIDALRYNFSGSRVFLTPSSRQIVNPGAAANVHTITFNTSNSGFFKGTITITTNSTEEPVITIPVRGVVVGGPIRPNG